MNYPRTVPRALLPHWPSDVALCGPMWLSLPPRIHRLRQGGAITLDWVEYLDRDDIQWDTPPGFYFDGMSYPWMTQVVFGWDKYDKYTLRTATNHDKNYTLHDFYPELWPNQQAKFDRDLLDGLKIEKPDGDHLKYIGVKLGGYSVWQSDGRQELVAQWLNFVDSPVELQAWIEGVIAADKKAA